ncbi:MAG: cytosolic protein [Desulfobacteraceae bacterium 4572_130]|nr:MAG: cytosolic protein [Desulfobacteraceae bacterium 4572_130]
MKDITSIIKQADHDILVKMVINSFRNILFHYGQWYAQVEHQLGMEKAMEIESKVWDKSFANQLNRLSKTFGFEIKNNVPSIFETMPKESLVNLLEKLGINWLANDGIWFQAVEKEFGMNDAKRCNDTCWSRYSPFEAQRIKELLQLSNNCGIAGLKKALLFRMYAMINKQSIEDIDENTIIFSMNECRVQNARKRKKLDDYPCKSGGLVEYPSFARTIDSKITTECIGCPPDDHPREWYCAWKFTLIT